MSSNSIHWGILGTSRISETMANAIHASSSSTLSVIGSRSEQAGKTFAEKFSIPSYGSYETLLTNPDIDAIYIGLPNHLHKEWLLRCIAAGKHVLCEKPFVISVQEALEVKAALEKTPRVCMEALMYQSHPFTQKIQTIVHSDVIGKIKLINATYTANIASVANKTAGGSIRNLGCYPISLVRLLTQNEPVEIYTTGRVLGNHDHQASLILKFENEAMAVISTADDMEMHWQFDVYGSNGRLSAVTNPWMPNNASKLLIHRNHHAIPEEITVQAHQPLYTYQIEAVNHRILKKDFKNEARISLNDSLENTRLLEYWRQQVLQKNSIRSHVA